MVVECFAVDSIVGFDSDGLDFHLTPTAHCVCSLVAVVAAVGLVMVYQARMVSVVVLAEWQGNTPAMVEEKL